MTYTPANCAGLVFNSMETSSKNHFAKWLRETREARGLSMNELSKKAGVSHVTVSTLESGKASSSKKMVIKLAAALEVDPLPGLDALSADALGRDEPEIIREPDEEYLQESIMAYSGPNPILNAAAATARSMKELFDRAGPALTGEEPTEELVYGRGPRKGITKVDGK